MMKKLTFDELVIEPTRRCNMTPVCPHCARGDPQPVDLSFEDIDALLNQVEQIYELQLTGGEPLCNVPAIEYFLQGMKKRGIHLWSLQLFTNGIAPIETIIEVVNAYVDYIDECRRADDVVTKKTLAIVHVSRDRYHSHGNVIEKKINELRIALQGKAKIIRYDAGNDTAAAGNALKNLDRSKLREILQGRINRKQIAIHDATHKPACLLYESFPLRRPDQVIVNCIVYITARGNLISSTIAGICEYTVCDAPINIVCHVTHPSIYDAIFEYNCDKLDCLDDYIFHLENMNDAERMKFIDDSIARNNDPNNHVMYKYEEHPEDESIFPIPNSVSEFEYDAITKLGFVPQEEQVRIANEIRERIQKWDGVSVPSNTESFVREVITTVHGMTNQFKRYGLDKEIQRNVNAYMEGHKAQKQAETTQKRIDATREKVNSDMDAINKVWAARAAKEK